MTRDILITGATGTVSSALIEALAGTGPRLRAMVRDPAAAEALRHGNVDVDVVTGDLGDPRSLPAAFAGATDLWLLTPNGPRSPEHSANAVWAAREAGVQRVVRLSAVGAAADAPTRSGRLHALSDLELRHSGLKWTILRPHWFMQNLLNEAGDIATGSLRLNMGDGRLGMIDARDIASFAAAVLSDHPDRHHARTYTPTGPAALSFTEVAHRLSAALGRQVDYRPATDAVVEARLLGFGVDAWITGMLTEYAQAYAAGWGDFTTTDFHAVTGRRPRDLADFAADHAAAFTTT